MHLAGRSDSKTHMRPVLKTDAMKRIPAPALPKLNAGTVLVLARPLGDSIGPSNDSAVILVGQDRLELSANGLRVRCSTN
jgi:hypothetical protein